MRDGEARPEEGDGDGAKNDVLRARRLFGALTARIADPALARRIEAELNDAWLRLQLARVAGDPALARAERRTCESLVEEARRRAAARGRA